MATANEAEYAAVLLALTVAIAAGVEDLALHTDSQLVWGQLTGRFRCLEARLVPLRTQALVLAAQIPRVAVVKIPRQLNSRADALARVGILAARLLP